MAAGDNFPFRNYVRSMADGDAGGLLSGTPVDWTVDALKVAMLTALPDYDEVTTNLHWSDVSGNEVSSVGTYPTGGVIMANTSVAWDGVEVRVDADDTVIAKDTVDGFSNAVAAVIYKDTGVPATSPLLIALDLGAATGNSVSDYVFQWAATGIFRYTITDGV